MRILIMSISVIGIMISIAWVKNILKSEKVSFGEIILSAVSLGIFIVNLIALVLIPIQIREDIGKYDQLKKAYAIYSVSPAYQNLSDLEKAEMTAELLTYQNTLKGNLEIYKAKEFFRAYFPKELERIEFVK